MKEQTDVRLYLYKVCPWIVVLAFGLWASVSSLALAQDTTRTTPLAVVGPYKISVSAVILEPLVADVRFLVTVLNAETGEPVRDATVRIVSRNDAREAEGWAFALNTPQQPELYKAAVHYDEEGVWLANVEVTSDLGEAIVSVPPIPVSDTTPSTSGAYAFLVTLVVLVGGGIYVTWRIRQAQRRRQDASADLSALAP